MRTQFINNIKGSPKLKDSVTLPTVVTVNSFDEKAVVAFNKDFTTAIETDQPFIPIVIDSYGGQVYSLMAMIDTIITSPVPVITIAEGKAMSCGVILFSCGSRRFASPNTTFLIHDVSGSAYGKVAELQASAKEGVKLDRKIHRLVSTNIGQKPSFIKDEIHKRSHADWYLTASEAKKINLATDIGIPTIIMSISANYKLE
jgi:ATP-dependent Clp protease protease subunit